MKTMKCRELGGPTMCNIEIHAQTFEEMVNLSKQHGMEMFKKGDEAHIAVMKKMKESMNNSNAMKNYMESTQKIFDSLPEDS
jgi:hypothetical protein